MENDPPPAPGSLKRSLFPTLLNEVENKGTQGVRVRLRRGTSSNHFHCPVPRSSSHIGPRFFLPSEKSALELFRVGGAVHAIFWLFESSLAPDFSSFCSDDLDILVKFCTPSSFFFEDFPRLKVKIRKNPRVRKNFVSAILGPEMAAPILWTPGKMRSFCRKTHVHKIPRFRGGSADFIFMGARTKSLFF